MESSKNYLYKYIFSLQYHLRTSYNTRKLTILLQNNKKKIQLTSCKNYTVISIIRKKYKVNYNIFGVMEVSLEN